MTEQDTDELYQVPLAEFVRVRDAIAARRRSAGDKAGVAEVKRARKPTLPAWAANQVVWHAPVEWQRLQAAADALRRGHARGASPDELRQASREQREALQACESRAAGFLVANGHAATPAVVQKASGTLQALAYGVPDAEPGRVQEELRPPGFEALAGMSLAVSSRGREPAPAAPAAMASVSSFADAASRRAERQAREQERAEQERADRRATIAAAEERHVRATRALGQARTEVVAQERKQQELEHAVEAVRRAAEAARSAVDAAAAEAHAAEAALEALREYDAEG